MSRTCREVWWPRCCLNSDVVSVQVKDAVERRMQALRAAGKPVPRRKVLHQQAVHVSVDGRKVCARCGCASCALQHSIMLARTEQPIKCCDHWVWRCQPQRCSGVEYRHGHLQGALITRGFAHDTWLRRCSLVT